MPKIHIGYVIVCRGYPPDSNPYKGSSAGLSLLGQERRLALRGFMNGDATEDYTFWYAPCHGGARLCTRDEVNWDASDLKLKDKE